MPERLRVPKTLETRCFVAPGVLSTPQGSSLGTTVAECGKRRGAAPDFPSRAVQREPRNQLSKHACHSFMSMNYPQQTNRSLVRIIATARKLFATVLALIWSFGVNGAPASVVPGRLLVKPRDGMNQAV